MYCIIVSPPQPYEVSTVIPIWWMRRLRPKEDRSFVQGHRCRKQRHRTWAFQHPCCCSELPRGIWVLERENTRRGGEEGLKELEVSGGCIQFTPRGPCLMPADWSQASSCFDCVWVCVCAIWQALSFPLQVWDGPTQCRPLDPPRLWYRVQRPPSLGSQVRATHPPAQAVTQLWPQYLPPLLAEPAGLSAKLQPPPNPKLFEDL